MWLCRDSRDTARGRQRFEHKKADGKVQQGGCGSEVHCGRGGAGKQALVLRVFAASIFSGWGSCGRKKTQPAPEEPRKHFGSKPRSRPPGNSPDSTFKIDSKSDPFPPPSKWPSLSKLHSSISKDLGAPGLQCDPVKLSTQEQKWLLQCKSEVLRLF